MSATLTLLARATESYYAGTPIMSDSAFDNLLATLPAEQQHALPIGEGLANHAGGASIAHPVPMLSLNNSPARNTAEEQAIDALRWLNDIRFPHAELIIEPKLDGMSLLVTYERGSLTRIETRGDGYTGTDITDRAKNWHTRGLPDRLARPLSLTLHGELYLPHRHPDRARYATPCAAAAALINGSTPSAPPSFAVHTPTHLGDIRLTPELDEPSYLAALAALGLGTVPILARGTLKTLLPQLPCLHTRAHRLAPVDGLVLKILSPSLRSRLGHTKRAPRFAFALKKYHIKN